MSIEIIVSIGIAVLSIFLLSISLVLNSIYKMLGEISDHLEKLTSSEKKTSKRGED